VKGGDFVKLSQWLETNKKTSDFVAIIQDDIVTSGSDALITYERWVSSGKPGKVKSMRTRLLVRNFGKVNEEVLEEDVSA
jgi:hypothetical protein